MDEQLDLSARSIVLPSWTMLFAREPEPDLELKVHQTSSGIPSSDDPQHSQKPPRLRILLLILLLLIVAGGAYMAMDPERMMTLLGSDQPGHPPSLKTPARPSVAQPPPSREPLTDMESAPPAPAPSTAPTPLFGEGQTVLSAPNPAAPTAPLLLTQDPEGTKPGQSIKPSDPLVVLDAEMHNNRWIYLVRSEEGTKGWVAEQQLAAKP